MELNCELIIPYCQLRLLDCIGSGRFGHFLAVWRPAHNLWSCIFNRRVWFGLQSTLLQQNKWHSKICCYKNSERSAFTNLLPYNVCVFLACFRNACACTGNFTEDDIEDLLKEGLKMKQFSHPHVLGLLGVCLDAGPAPFIVLPFMTGGSLLSYAKNNRSTLVRKVDEEDDVVSKNF